MDFSCRQFISLFFYRVYFTSTDWPFEIICSWFSFGGLYVLKTCPFLLDFPICWHMIVHSILLCFLYFYGIFCYFFSFISYFVYLDPLFSWWAWPEVCRFCLCFQRTNSWFYWLKKNFFKYHRFLIGPGDTRVEVIEAELEVWH